ncbi:translation initiation factor IF-3 [Candidatus Desantisbacteria bacterium]|nr:translation initiation factor IF-3 [Candidatus Desantisbacteria bacterium]
MLINNMIRAKTVRVISEDGNQMGIMTTSEALKIAYTSGMDLVELSPDADPPVCKVINYGKFKYELNKKSKESKKHQKLVVLKEIKINPKIGDNDLAIKINHIHKFIESCYKVKVTVNFKGRQLAHTEFGKNIMERIIIDLKDIAHVETPPRLDGPNMIMMLIPINITAKDKVS